MTVITTNSLNRVRATTTTPGLGSYTVGAAVDGSHRDFSDVGTGQRVPYVCCDTADFEIGEGVITVSGTTTLSRLVIHNSSNGGSAVDWGAGTRDLFIDFPSQMLALLNRIQTWDADAHQNWNGAEHRLSPDGNYKILATNALLSLLADLQSTSGAQFTITEGGLFTAEYRNTSATNSGGLRLLLASPSSTADGDQLLDLLLSGYDSGNNITDYGRIRAKIVDETNSTEDGEVYIGVIVNGTMTDVVKFDGTYVTIPSGRTLLLGKAASDVTTSGAEITATGRASFQATGQASLHVGRDGDGNLLVFYVAGSSVAVISAASGVVTYGTFTGAHFARWAEGFEPDEDPPIGALLCMVDEGYASVGGEFTRLPCVRVATKAKDKAVYGQFGGWTEQEIELSDAEIEQLQKAGRWRDVLSVERIVVSNADARRLEQAGERVKPVRSRVTYRQMQVWALGTSPIGVPVVGPVEVGDYIMTSDVPGVGILAPDGTDGRYVVAKAAGAVPEGATAYVRATLHAG